MLKSELRAFDAVARNNGFSRAAKVLNVSQPTLSAQVKALEQRYEIELFNRVGRSVRLTAPGKELFEATTRLMQAERDARELLESYQGFHSGSLNLAAVGPFHATDMIVAFKNAYPLIDVEVRFGNSARCFERIVSYEADVGIIAEVPADKRVTTLPYSTHEVVVFVNTDHPFASRTEIEISELAGQKVLRREPGSTTRMAIESALQKRQIETRTILELGSREAIWKGVEQGLGIGFVADFEFVPHPNLRAVRISDMDVRTKYFLAYLTERSQSKLITNFCKVALDLVGEAR